MTEHGWQGILLHNILVNIALYRDVSSTSKPFSILRVIDCLIGMRYGLERSPNTWFCGIDISEM